MTQRACVAGSDARRDRAGGPPARPGSIGRTRSSRGSVSGIGLLPGGMGSLLLGFGLASAVGVALAGRVTRPAAGLVVASAATAVGLIGLLRASEAALVWWRSSGSASPVEHAAARADRDPPAGRHRTPRPRLSPHPVVFNGGIAVGAAAATCSSVKPAHRHCPRPRPRQPRSPRSDWRPPSVPKRLTVVAPSGVEPWVEWHVAPTFLALLTLPCETPTLSRASAFALVRNDRSGCPPLVESTGS